MVDAISPEPGRGCVTLVSIDKDDFQYEEAAETEDEI